MHHGAGQGSGSMIKSRACGNEPGYRLTGRHHVAGLHGAHDLIRIPLGALLLVAAFCAHTAEPWKRLPPTPTMLPHTIGKHVTVNGAVLDFLRDYR
jgi:hypothetical protein